MTRQALLRFAFVPMTMITLSFTALSSPPLWVLAEPTMAILMAGLAAYAILVGSMIFYAAFQRRGLATPKRQPRTISDELAAMRYEMLMMRGVVKLATTRLNLAEAELEELRSDLASQTKPPQIDSQPSLEDPDEEEPARIVLFSPAADFEADAGDEVHDMTAPPDDLTRIWGIGAGNQQRLQENGIYYFRQIAGWSEADVDRFNTLLRFKGRIEREGWISQAKTLIRESGDRAA